MHLSVIRSYAAVMGWLPLLIVVVFFVLDQGAAMGANIWLSVWSSDASAFNATSSRHMYLGVYASFGIIQGNTYQHQLHLVARSLVARSLVARSLVARSLVAWLLVARC